MPAMFRPMLCAALAALFAAVAHAQPLPPDGEVWINAGSYGDLHIVLPEAASEEIAAAGAALKKYWAACTDREPTIGTTNGARINVWIGAAAYPLIDADERESLGPGECILRTFTPTGRQRAAGATKQLLIAGGSDAATADAVYEFLTRFCGVRWIAPGIVTVKRLGYYFLAIDHRYAPPFPQRVLSHAPLAGSPAEIAEYLRANRLWRAGAPAANFAPAFARHTLMTLLPPDRFMADHPDFYAAGADGARAPGHLCASNPRAADAAADEIARLLEAAPEDAGAQARIARLSIDGRTAWSVSAEPGAAPCACAACAAIDAAAGSPMGSLLTLVNRVAERLEARFPGRGLRVHTLAFGPFRTPPKSLRPAGNVDIEVATLGINTARSLRDRSDPANAAFAEDLRAWSRAAGALYVWDNACNVSNPLWPMPNFDHLRDNYQLFAQYGLAGVDAQTGLAAEPGYHESALVRSYLIARLLWDTDLSAEEEIAAAAQGCFGPAAEAARAYWALIARAAAAYPGAVTQTGRPAWWSPVLAAEAAALWAGPAGRVLPEPFATRVRREALPAAVLTACGDAAALDAALSVFEAPAAAALRPFTEGVCAPAP